VESPARHSDAGIGNLEHRASCSRRRRTAISPFERELEGVGEQIEHDLFPHLAIDIDRLAKVLAFDP
jgi:hypothetical protein